MFSLALESMPEQEAAEFRQAMTAAAPAPAAARRATAAEERRAQLAGLVGGEVVEM